MKAPQRSHPLERFLEGLSRVTGWIGALCLASAALIVTEGVIVRKVFGLSTTWQIEAAVFLLIYVCFVGAAYTETRGGHLNVDLLIVHLPPRGRESVMVAASWITAALAALVAAYAWPMWWEAWVRNDRSESLWSPPLWVPYLFLPTGMTLLAVQSVITGLRRLRLLRAGAFTETVVRAELRDVEIPQGEGGGGRE